VKDAAFIVAVDEQSVYEGVTGVTRPGRQVLSVTENECNEA